MGLPELPMLAPLHAVLPDDFPQQLRDLAEVLFLQLLQDAADLGAAQPHVLAAVAKRQTERISAEMGGVNLYIHKGVSYRLTPRNREMCAKFRGDYKALAREYKLSEQQVRNIVDEYQREVFTRRQCDMFPAQATTAPTAGVVKN